MPDHLPFFGGRFGEGQPLRLGQQFTTWHGCPS
jgi:hypothetical protein